MALLHARSSGNGAHPAARYYALLVFVSATLLWLFLSFSCHGAPKGGWSRGLAWLAPAADLCREQRAWAALNSDLGMPAPSVTGRGCSTLSYGGQEKGVTAEGAICTPPSPAEVEAVRRLVAATPTNRTFREAWGLQVDRSSGPAAESDNNTASKDALEWSYLITPDFQVRSQMTARMVEMEGCEHVVEVGGYLTPIERYLVGGGGVARLTNIEPGYSRAPLSNVLLPGGRCVRALSLPLTLSEYLAAAELARGSSSSTAGALLYGGGGGPSYSGRQDAVCVVALGYSVPHRDGDADYGLMSDAQWVALETSTNSVHNEVALNLTVALLTQPPGAATHRLVTDTRLQLRDPHADQHRHGDNSRRRLVTLRRVLRREEQAAAYLAAAAAATGGRRHTPALSQWEGSNGQALCATVSDFRCTGNRTTGLKQPRQVAGGALCARHFYRIPGVHTFAPPFARLLPLDEFGVCSQCGQDGVISRIFEHVGIVAAWPQRGYYVEFGARIPNLLNSAYLRKHCGWSGLLMDGAPGATEHSPCHQLDACEGMEHVKQAFISAANVNELFARHGVPARFDLLTIDVDHQDYWIWKALLEARQFTPSVVAVEFNPNFPNTQAVTVPRNDSAVWDGSRHYGASLAAFVGLAAGHGYCYCYNLAFTHALFVRCELLHPLDRALELPPETLARGFTLHKPDPLSRSWEEVQLASE